MLEKCFCSADEQHFFNTALGILRGGNLQWLYTFFNMTWMGSATGTLENRLSTSNCDGCSNWLVLAEIDEFFYSIDLFHVVNCSWYRTSTTLHVGRVFTEGRARVALKNFPDYPIQVATSLFTSSHCYITFHEYSAIICIEINPQRISFNHLGKIAEQFYKL